jgi:hypothetical protein
MLELCIVVVDASFWFGDKPAGLRVYVAFRKLSMDIYKSSYIFLTATIVRTVWVGCWELRSNARNVFSLGHREKVMIVMTDHW